MLCVHFTDLNWLNTAQGGQESEPRACSSPLLLPRVEQQWHSLH